MGRLFVEVVINVFAKRIQSSRSKCASIRPKTAIRPFVLVNPCLRMHSLKQLLLIIETGQAYRSFTHDYILTVFSDVMLCAKTQCAPCARVALRLVTVRHHFKCCQAKGSGFNSCFFNNVSFWGKHMIYSAKCVCVYIRACVIFNCV